MYEVDGRGSAYAEPLFLRFNSKIPKGGNFQIYFYVIMNLDQGHRKKEERKVSRNGIRFEETSTRAILSVMHRYMRGEEAGEDMESLRELQVKFEEAALKKLDLEEFAPRFDDYKLCVFTAMVEKMAEQYRASGGNYDVMDEMEALQLLSLMGLAKFLNVMTRPEEHHNQETGMLANNAYFNTQQLEVEMS